MLKLSDKSRDAFAACFATRGKNKDMLKATAPSPSTSLAYAAWQGAMLSVNPYKTSIYGMMFMTAEQREVCTEITEYCDALPKPERIAMQRDRKVLEALGAW